MKKGHSLAATSSAAAAGPTELLRRFLGIAWLEWRLVVRSPLFRISALVCWGLAVLLVHGVIAVQSSTMLNLADPGELVAEAIELQIGLFVPAMVAFVAAFSGARERRPGIPETLFTTPPSSEEFVLGKFLAVASAAVVLLLGTAAAAWLWLVYVEDIPASGLPFYLVGLWWWKPILYVAALGFTAGLVLPGAVGGALVVAYLIAVLVATRFLSPLFNPFFGYLSTGYLLLGAALVFAAAVVYQRQRRGSHFGGATLVGGTAVALLCGCAVTLVRAAGSYEAPPFHHDPALQAGVEHQVKPGEMFPSFRVRDTRGEWLTPGAPRGVPTVLIILPEVPPPVAVFPPARALVYGSTHSGFPAPNLLLLVLTRDPADGVRWGRLISPQLRVVCQYAEPGRPPLGLCGSMGLGWGDVRLGAVAVIDGSGRYLGWRAIYDLFRPPALLSLLNQRAGLQ
ncbi:MAG: ABC transporter permease, partial [Chloroflexi bacterium]|nr:ABC transporter permease [Chloroflexota bacterium]